MNHDPSYATRSGRRLMTKAQYLSAKDRATSQFPESQVPHKDLVAKLPASSILKRTSDVPVYDQGQTGTCTANAIAGAVQFVELDHTFLPSRLFIYYQERIREGQTNSTLQDSGADPIDGLLSLKGEGVCPESLWPFNPANLELAPSETALEAALQHKKFSTSHICPAGSTPTHILTAIKTSIAINSIPTLIGIAVYDSFESDTVASTGIVPMPNTQSESLLGYHEVLITGYDDSKQAVMVRNSWGTSWGQSGYCWMPYTYICDPDLCSQFLAVTKA
jgi:C1A family cysteine protease